MAPDVVLADNASVTALALALALALAVPAGLAVLTGMGSHRRGARAGVVVLSAALFPLAWVAWYVSDVHPYRHRAASHAD